MGDSPHQKAKYQGKVQTNVNLRQLEAQTIQT